MLTISFISLWLTLLVGAAGMTGMLIWKRQQAQPALAPAPIQKNK